MSIVPRKRGRLGNQGMALIGVLVLSALLMSLALTLAMTVKSDTQLRGAFGSGVTGFYAAESGLNAGMGEYRNIFLEYNVPNGSDFNTRTLTVGNRTVNYKMTERAGNPANIVIPSGQVFAGLNAIQYRYIVNSTAKNTVGDTEAGVGAEFLVGYIPLFQFVAFYKNDLEILPGANMVLNGRVHTNGSLYLNSDATLTIADNPAQQVFNVQISAGKSIYRGRKNDTGVCGGTVVVDKLEDKVSPFGDWDPKNLDCSGGTRSVPTSELAAWKGSMIRDLGNIAIPEPDIILPPSSVTSGGTGDPGVYWDKADLRIVMHVRNGNLAAGPILPYDIEVVTVSGATDVARTTALKNFMLDGDWNNGRTAGRGPSNYRGTMPIFVTDVPFAAGSGCAQGQPACTNGNITSYAPKIGADLPGAVPLPNLRTFSPSAAQGAYTERMGQGVTTGAGAPFAFDRDYRRGGFYNMREKKWMLLLNINVRDLIWWNSQNAEPFFATNDSSEGGLVIYATIDGPLSNNSSNNYGVRIFGSNDIPLAGGIGVSADPTGITVVSDQAIYVLGDFNRGTAAGGTARQPASIIGDSVNVLSGNYWRSQAACNTVNCRDGQSVLSLGDANRDATSTTINAAFLGGVDDTTTGNYNGGLENYPRFHEDWGGQTLTYQGSFVSLGTTTHVNGAWCGTGNSCNIYNPPQRLWNFDPAYNNAANLPPLTPRFVYVQQVLFTEDFK
ncbi:MAG: hypothetical protein SF182_09815 [Deltaproteobacteria bacterium]|nr:hypothetical protein [Deltaproteobacteria bacterium]